MDDVVLEYRRDGAGVTSGRVFYREGEQESLVTPFEKRTFPQMMVLFAEAVTLLPEAGAIMQRNDRPGLQPFRLDKETVQLLRVDPVMVIRSMSFPDNTTVELKKKTSALPVSPIIVGYDAIASTFGDEVYARRRADRLECPCCGVWAALSETESRCRSRACAVVVPVTMRGDRWASVAVPTLLATDRDRFFLPRGWNKTQPWVTRDDLEFLYQNWLRIKGAIPS